MIGNFFSLGSLLKQITSKKTRAKKLRQKNCDIIVANDVRDGMESDENEVHHFVSRR